MSEPWDFGIRRDFGSHLIQTLHWMNEEQAQRGKESLRAQVRDAARTDTGVSKLPWAPCAHGPLCLWGKEAVVERRRLLGGRPQSGLRKEGRAGTKGNRVLRAVGARQAAEPCPARGHSYSNHVLRAGLAALNYEPRRGLSSCRGFDTSLPGCLCWTVRSSPEQFRTRRRRRQVEAPGTPSFLRTLAPPPLPPCTEAAGTGSKVAGTGSDSSVLCRSGSLEGTCTWQISKSAEKSKIVSSTELISVKSKEPRTPECWLEDIS